MFATPEGVFRQALRTLPPRRARAPEGDCLEALRAFDGLERLSLADSTDLATRETVDLEFEDVPGADLGLVVASRQSLLSTYLFYQGLAYLGRSAGPLMASLERRGGGAWARSAGVWKALGGIEVSLKDGSRGWTRVGELNETGPLATDVRLLPLPRARGGRFDVRLRMARGHWRLNYVALAVLGPEVEPIRMQPSLVRRGDMVDEEARSLLLDSTRVLATLPGDQYTLVYRLPGAFERHELFLESRGYYIEWMRDDWLAQEEPARAVMMIASPRRALRAMAPDYKRIEAQLEAQFWRNRYAGP
ncbi:MAG: hypothetical protein HY704_01080 [Gemmatimonadetes bacterium]|nr:hypothetical protein [Gemmatimonadota bacterium]